MKQLILCLFGMITVLFSHNIFARPISYPSGWTLMGNNDAFENNLHLHYTPHRDYSVGYKGVYNRENNAQFHGAQMNYLLHRENRQASQANFYLKTSFGAETLHSQTAPSGFIGFAADWEDRDYFIMYENHFHDSSQTYGEFVQKARIGFTPYVGDYGDLHTWIMLQAEHRPKAIYDADQMTFTPMLRFFYDVYLAEIGVSDRKKMMFNFIIRH